MSAILEKTGKAPTVDQIEYINFSASAIFKVFGKHFAIKKYGDLDWDVRRAEIPRIKKFQTDSNRNKELKKNQLRLYPRLPLNSQISDFRVS